MRFSISTYTPIYIYFYYAISKKKLSACLLPNKGLQDNNVFVTHHCSQFGFRRRKNSTSHAIINVLDMLALLSYWYFIRLLEIL